MKNHEPQNNAVLSARAQRILVPLDGSHRAEKALAVASRLARATGGTLLLLQVISLEYISVAYPGQPASLRQSRLNMELANARMYLEHIAQTEALLGLKTEILVAPGTAAATIISFAQTHKAQLIVLCSHGYSGLKRWIMGSVAQKVVRYSSVPVLLLREHSPKSQELCPKIAAPMRALVALDGSSFSEAIIEPTARAVAALAAPGEGVLHLMEVIQIPTVETAMEYEHYDIEVRQGILQEAGDYLQKVAEWCSREFADALGLRVTWSVEEGIDVAETLIRAAELGEGTGIFAACDLIAIATHGRSGLKRWAVGSVTERILATSSLPLLVLRPHTASTQPAASDDAEEPAILLSPEV